MRSMVPFLAGFVAGMLFLLVLLWGNGSLHPVRAAGPTLAPLPAAIPSIPAGASPTITAPAVHRPPVAAAPVLPVAAPAISGEPPSLIIPVQGADPAKIMDTFTASRGGSNRHEAVDIMAPRGTPVLAAADGAVEKLFQSKRGGTTIYQFDPSRTWCYYYAHLDHYAAGIVQGSVVRKGQVIGYVGSTGDASPSAPHLHFTIFKLGPEKQWWKGTAVDPYPILMLNARQ
jgi:murein DD-endopeptidase MepM/ murein hydrolase activator NlpD